MASNPEDVIADIVQQMRTRAMVAGQASLEERDDALREAQEHEAYFLTTACDALEAEVARLTAAQATPPANPTPQGPLTCESCGASDVYRCGCYDRCRCDHDRRSHTPHGICTHVGCACTNGLHGRGTWATPPASPEPPTITGDTSDGYHTFNELYAYRKAYHALVVNEWARQGLHDTHKSWRHADGEPCFGGGWFIVVAETPAGQVSNHYKADDWPLFQCPERERGNPWDGHTPQVALDRLLALAASPVPVAPQEQRIDDYRSGYSAGWSDGKNGEPMRDRRCAALYFRLPPAAEER